MTNLPSTEDMLKVARRVIWFETPEQALGQPVRFLAYLMTYGTLEDLALVRHHLSREDFREALEQAPPGILDSRSWSYWNTICGRLPVPPLPERSFGETNDCT